MGPTVVRYQHDIITPYDRVRNPRNPWHYRRYRRYFDCAVKAEFPMIFPHRPLPRVRITKLLLITSRARCVIDTITVISDVCVVSGVAVIDYAAYYYHYGSVLFGFFLYIRILY